MPLPHRQVRLVGEAAGEGEELADAGRAGQHRRPRVVDQAVALDGGEVGVAVADERPAAGRRE